MGFELLKTRSFCHALLEIIEYTLQYESFLSTLLMSLTSSTINEDSHRFFPMGFCSRQALYSQSQLLSKATHVLLKLTK